MDSAKLKSIKLNSQMLDDLLYKIKSNDSKAFQEFYEIVKAPVYGYSLTILKNHDEALDNTQDVFISIYKSLDNYDFKGKAMNWIFTITKNLALMKIRKSKNKMTEELDESKIINSNIKEEDKLVIRSLIEILNDEEKKIILMHLIGNLRFNEISKILELNLSTTLSKYHRALKKLRLEWRNS